jgi:F0F1-type ATP synthase beta subunit
MPFAHLGATIILSRGLVVKGIYQNEKEGIDKFTST